MRRTFTGIILAVVVTIILAACSHSSSKPSSTTSPASPQGHSRIGVVLADDPKKIGHCAIAPINFPVELGIRSNWQIDIYPTVAADAVSCGATLLSVNPTHVSG